MRIALLQAGRSGPEDTVHRLGRGLIAAGHDVTLLAPGVPGRARHDGVPVLRVGRVPTAPLRVRKVGEEVADVPLLALALRAGRYDVAHAFGAPEALAATWAKAGASVLTFCAPVAREGLADRRLRLAVLERAIERSGAVVAGTAETEASLWRWLGVRARLLAASDTAGHAALYEELAGG